MNEQEVYDHLINFHKRTPSSLFGELYKTSFDVSVVHEQEHTGETEHAHEVDGTVTSSTKTVLGGKVISLTSAGWSYDSTAAEALQELNSIINNREVVVKFVNDGTMIKGRLYHKTKTISVETNSFISAVKTLLGEAFNYIDERNNE